MATGAQRTATAHMIGVRLDKWLWAARFFKTRSQATTAANGGKVQVNGGRGKAGQLVRSGDLLRIRKGGSTFEVQVRALAQKRASATIAQTLYAETDTSIAARQRQRDARRAPGAQIPRPATKPDKRDRRQLRQLKQERE